MSMFGKNSKDNLAQTVDTRLSDVLLRGEKDMLADALDTVSLNLPHTTLSIIDTERNIAATTEVNDDFIRGIEYSIQYLDFSKDGTLDSTFFRARTAFFDFKPLKYGHIVVGLLLIESDKSIDFNKSYGKYADIVLQKLSLIAYIGIVNHYIKKRDAIDPATGLRTRDTLLKDFSKLIRGRGNDYLTYVCVGVTNLNSIRMEKGHPAVNDTVYRFVRKFRESLGRDLYEVSEDRFAFFLDKDVYIARDLLCELIDAVSVEVPKITIKGVVVSVISEIDFADYYIGIANKTLTERIVLPSKGDAVTVLHGVEPFLLKEDHAFMREEI